jgi:DNA/RNA-binding domain of Phe-tRNA-synthetase-like protein
MTFAFADECLRLGLRAGAIVFRNVRIGVRDAVLQAEIEREAHAIRSRFKSAGDIRALPEVIAYQDLLRQVGVNPRREQPSVEKLLGFALRHGNLPAINSLVDAYNLVSIRSLCSLGAHDLDKFTPPATLRLLTGRESFTPLGSDKSVSIIPGEYGYVDAEDRVLCRLDVLQAEFSKVTTSTVNALLIIEGTATHPADHLRRAFDGAAEQVTRHCGGTAEVIAPGVL